MTDIENSTETRAVELARQCANVAIDVADDNLKPLPSAPLPGDFDALEDAGLVAHRDAFERAYSERIRAVRGY